MATSNDKTFSDYKREITLERFIQDQGFSCHTPWAKSKSTRAVPCYENRDGDRVYLFSTAKGERYFDIGRSKSGDLIEFIRDRIAELGPAGAGETAAIYYVLKGYLGTAPNARAKESWTPPPAIRKFGTAPEKRFDQTLFLLSPLVERSYLHSQGLKDATLDSPEFAGRILNVRNPKMDGGKASGYQTVTNTAFPIYASYGGPVIGLEERNASFKGYGLGSESGRGVWMSQGGSGVRELAIFESAKDALAYHQLFLPQGVQYISTGGNIASGQLETILDHRESFAEKPRVRLCFDRDLAGSEFDTYFILAQLVHGGAAARRLATSPQEPYAFIFPVKDAAGNQHSALARLSAAIDSGAIPSGKWSMEEGGFKLTAPRTMESLDALNRTLMDAFDWGRELILTKAQLKDHGEDLQQALTEAKRPKLATPGVKRSL